MIETTLRFRPGAKLGIQGQNSEVFFAADPQLGDTLVVKQIARSHLDIQRFEEAKVLYSVRHPHIVEILYSCSTEHHVYLAMPRYAGSLEAILQRGPITVRDIVHLGTQFLSGLHHVHTRGLVHFDVKPSNVLIALNGSAALGDFGMCKALDVHGLATPDKIYEAHMPPEFLQSPSLSVASDVYQAGLCLYRMCTGTQLWREQLGFFVANLGSGWMAAIAAGQFPSRDLLPPHIPRRLRDIIARAIDVDPNRRYPTVLDLLNDLAKVDEHLDWQFKPTPGRWTWERESGVYLEHVALVLSGRQGPRGECLADVVTSRVNRTSGKGRAPSGGAATGINANTPFAAIQTALRAFPDV